MSRKHWKQKRKFPWLIIFFGGALLVIAGFLFANKGGSASNDSGGIPQIAVDQQKIDYGYVKFGNDKTFKIKVTNNGNGILHFKDQPYIEVREGC